MRHGHARPYGESRRRFSLELSSRVSTSLVSIAPFIIPEDEMNAPDSIQQKFARALNILSSLLQY